MTDTTDLAPLDQTYDLVISELEQMQPLADRVRFTRRGLELPPDLTYDECTGLTYYISGRLRFDAVEANLMQLALGQLIVYSESRFGDTYTQWLDATGLAYGTLANAAWVARQVDASCWHENLSFAHHTTVAPLPPEEQDEWLDTAEREELGANELRRRIQAHKDTKAGRDPDEAAIERELQRVTQKIADTLGYDHERWATVIRRGLLYPIVFKLRYNDALDMLEMLEHDCGNFQAEIYGLNPDNWQDEHR